MTSSGLQQRWGQYTLVDVCVRVCETLVCVGLPLVPLHHCYSSLGQETAVEREAGVKVCAQPFEGYRALLANINQIAWSWAFTELEKPHHVSTFAQDTGSSTLSVTLDDTWPPRWRWIWWLWIRTWVLRVFSSQRVRLRPSLRRLIHWFMCVLEMKMAWTRQMRSQGVIKTNEGTYGIFLSFAARNEDVSLFFFEGKLVTPLTQQATSPQWAGWLLCGFLPETVNMSSTNENHHAASWWIALCVCVCVCVCMWAWYTGCWQERYL